MKSHALESGKHCVCARKGVPKRQTLPKHCLKNSVDFVGTPEGSGTPGSQGHILRALLYCALFLLYSEYHKTRPLGNQMDHFLLGTPKNQCTLPAAFNSTLYASGLISLLLNLGTSDLHFPVCSPTIPVTWCHLNLREDSP